MSEHNKPVNEIRLGTIKASTWRNETETGPRYNTHFTRIYRDGEQWKSTDSFGRDDLLVLAKVANEAHSWIFTQTREPVNPPAAAPGSPPPPLRPGSPQPPRNR